MEVASRVAPLLAVVVLAGAWGRTLNGVVAAVVGLLLVAAVLAAVHHAEVVAHRVGEPFGSLVLAVAVTVIEVALIVALMASGGAKAETLARDTVFSAVMITTAALPVGANAFLFAQRYAVDEDLTTASMAVSTLLALFTLPLVMLLVRGGML